MKKNNQKIMQKRDIFESENAMALKRGMND